MEIRIRESPKSQKKYRAELPDGTHVDFGQRGASDYTIHKDHDRMIRYLQRHTHDSDWSRTRKLENLNSTREHWNISGIRTPGFWSRWFLWSAPSKRAAIRLMENKFPIKIKLARKH